MGGVDLGDAKVTQLHHPSLGHKNIVWLDVPMEDFTAVRVLQRAKQLAHQANRLDRREAVLGIKVVLEGLAPANQLHHDVGEFFLIVIVKHLDDVDVVKFGCRLRLGQKPARVLFCFGRVKLVLSDQLDCARSPELGINALIDDTHRALAQLADDLVLA